MAVLASVVINRLNVLFSDTGNNKWSEAEKLEAVNAAIDGAWPHIRAVAEDTSQTIDSTTYSYTPSATPENGPGFAQAFARRSGWDDVLLRQVSQSRIGTAVTVRLSENEAANYTGWTLRLVYTTRTARVTATTDSIELPLDYLWRAAALFLVTNKLFDTAKADVDPYRDVYQDMKRDVAGALVQNQTPITHMIPWMLEGSTVRGGLTSGEHA